MVPMRILPQQPCRCSAPHHGIGCLVVVRNAGLNTQTNIELGRITRCAGKSRIELFEVMRECRRRERIGDEHAICNLPRQSSDLRTMGGEVYRQAWSWRCE